MSTDQLYREVSIGALPNDVLLEIFYFYLDPPQCHHPSFIVGDTSLDAWHTLVHVCQRWRYTVFASPRYLNLQLHCTNKTPAKDMLDIWPEFPIVVSYHSSPNSRPRGVLNVISALQCNRRVCEINLLGPPKSLLKRFTALKVAFTALTSLRVSSSDDYEGWSVLPDSFLGGYAPCLRSLELHGVSFPALQKLLLYSTDLVTLRLERIPISWYISPEEMASFLSTLTKLEEFAIGFLPLLFPWHQLTQHHVPPATRFVLRALTSLRFRGDCWYLEALISRILLPLLDSVDITFAAQPAIQPAFHAPLLRELICSTEAFEAPHRADLSFHPHFVNITLSQPEDMANCRTLKLGALCRGSDFQRSSLAQLCNLTLPPLPTLEHLYIHCSFMRAHWINELDNAQWLEVLRPFTSVKNLYLSDQLVLYVARVLQGLSGEGVTEVLPALQNLFLPGLKPTGAVLKVIGNFLATRQLSGHAVSVHY